MPCCSGFASAPGRKESSFINGDGHSGARRQSGEEATHAGAGDQKGLGDTKEMKKLSKSLLL